MQLICQSFSLHFLPLLFYFSNFLLSPQQYCINVSIKWRTFHDELKNQDVEMGNKETKTEKPISSETQM